MCRNFPNDANRIATFEGRSFNKQQLKRTLANRQTVNRDWVIYSPSQKSMFCFVTAHENSKNYVLNELAYKQRAKDTYALTIDSRITIYTEIEKKYWRSILERVVAVKKFWNREGYPSAVVDFKTEIF